MGAAIRTVTNWCRRQVGSPSSAIIGTEIARPNRVELARAQEATPGSVGFAGAAQARRSNQRPGPDRRCCWSRDTPRSRVYQSSVAARIKPLIGAHEKPRCDRITRFTASADSDPWLPCALATGQSRSARGHPSAQRGRVPPLHTLERGPAAVFGRSVGALIGLDLVVRYAAQIRVAVFGLRIAQSSTCGWLEYAVPVHPACRGTRAPMVRDCQPAGAREHARGAGPGVHTNRSLEGAGSETRPGWSRTKR